MKKQKGKKGASKKKDDKSEDTATDAKTDTVAEEATESKDEPDDKHDGENTTADETKDDSADVNTDEKKDEDKQGIIRQPSLSAQSRQRSESFRKQGTVVSPGLKSPGSSPLDSELEVKEVYRKQAARIEELEKENKALKDTQDESASKLSQREEELERLREDSGQMAELKSKASSVDEKTKEIDDLVSTVELTDRIANTDNATEAGIGLCSTPIDPSPAICGIETQAIRREPCERLDRAASLKDIHDRVTRA